MIEDGVEAGADGGVQGGIQSVEVGGALLKVLAANERPLMLKNLAAEAGMAPAKAHRYLVSWMRLGMVEQDPVTGRYVLGPFALELGLAALNRLDPVRLATPVLADLRDALGHAAALAVWGSHGPTIVRWEEAPHAVAVNLRTGAVMPLLSSATGRCYLAFGSPELAAEGYAAALAEPGAPDRAEVETALAEYRQRGLARVKGELVPGINALAAPVFDHQRRIVAALTVVGPAGHLDAGWNSAEAKTLKAAADALSARLGYTA